MTSHRSKDTEFRFHFIRNIQGKGHSKTKLNADAYFRIQHAETGLWFGFDEFQLFEDNSHTSVKVYNYEKDLNTYKFVQAKFGDVWEIKFLMSQLPVFFDVLQNIIPVNRNENEIKRDQKKFPVFNDLYPQILQTINNLEDFLNNRVHANVILDSPYGAPCAKRQNLMREHSIFTLICLLLIKAFPSAGTILRPGPRARHLTAHTC